MLKQIVALAAVASLGMGAAFADPFSGSHLGEGLHKQCHHGEGIGKHSPHDPLPVKVIQGERGEQGIQGETGATGAQGIAGKNGVVNYTKVDKQINTGDKTTLSTSEQYTNASIKTTLVSANTDSQIMANAAQSNSETYSNQEYQQANANAQGYAAQAQANAEQYAQGAANQAQANAEQFAASGIAAALAMPSSPVLAPGQLYVGTEMGTYDGQQAVGAKVTYQITARLNANVGVSGGFGQYGHTAVAAGVGYTFGN